MILSYRRENYQVPRTSTCLIHTTGMICDGGSVSVTSPVFASMNFTSGAINTSDQFDVTVKFSQQTREDNGEIIMLTDEMRSAIGDIFGTLHCEDNDTFNMYVVI